MTINPGHSSGSIKELLARRHSKDVFIPECHTGQFKTGMQSFDGWSMKRSYSNPLITGYEIKISRGDFTQDKKWPGYLPFCNEFYFVTPAGLVTVDEIPEGVGLIWTTKNGRGLRVQKNSVWREMDENYSARIFAYIIITRAKVVDSDFSIARAGQRREEISDKKYWEKWLQKKEIDYKFGKRVGKAISETVRDEIEKVRLRNRELEKQNREYEKVKEFCGKIGLDTAGHFWNLDSMLREKLTGVSQRLINSVSSVERDLKLLKNELEKVQ